MAQFYLGALVAAIALDVALLVYWKRYNAGRVSQNLTPIDVRTTLNRAKEWMGRVTLLDFVRMLFGRDRWRIWLLILAVSLALVAQNSFPPPDVTLTDQQPLPDPLWKTLLFLEGPLEPFRPAVWLYAVVVLLVLIAYSGEAIDSLPWRTLNLASPETDNEATSLPAHSHSQFDFTVARWRFAVGIEGPQNPWAATLLMAALMIVALGLAVSVFFIFNQPPSASNPGLALWLLSIFLVLAATAIYDVSRDHLSGRPGAPFNRLMTTSLVVVVISVGLLWRGQGIPGMLLWAASLLALGTGWWAARRAGAPRTTQRLSFSLWLELFLFIAIIGVASYFRLARITELAPGINNDAAETGRVAISYALGQSPFTPFANVGWGFETSFIYYIAGWLKVLSPAYVAIRVAAATMGIFTVVAVYFLGRRLGGPRLAVLASSFLASSGIHIVYSGVGYRLIIQPLFEAITLFFFWQAFNKGRLRDFMLGGLFLGLAIHAHNSSRPNPVLYAVFIIFLFLSAASHRRQFLARYALPLAISAMAAIVAIAPMAGYAAANWGIYNGRANFVFVGHRMEEMEAASPGSYWSPLARNIVVGSLIFNQRGNGNDFFVGDPAFDFPVTILFVLGLAYTLRHWRKPLPFFLLSWFGMGVATGYLSEPNANRTVGAIVPAYVMMSLFLLASADLIVKALGLRWRLIANGVLAALMITIAIQTYRTYVGPNYKYRWGYAEEATAIGSYTNSIRDDYSVNMTTEYWVTDTMRLMTYRAGEDPYTLPYSRFDLALALSGEFPRGKPVAVVLGSWQEELWAREALLERYPGSRVESIPSLKTPWYREDPAGYAVLIPAEALNSTTQIKSGLLAKYYQGLDWQGEPYEVFVDRFFSIPIQPPVPFSASWEGTLHIDIPGDYVFRLRATNRAQLFIDNTRVINLDAFDISHANERHEAEMSINLSASSHTLRILYSYEGGDRDLQLFWKKPDNELARLPFDLLTPRDPDAP